MTLASPALALGVVCEDVIVNGIFANRTPLALSTWRQRTGLSELPPLRGEAARNAWALRVGIDAAALHTYAQAVRAATDAYLSDDAADELTTRVLNALLLHSVRRACTSSVPLPS
jgi:hypothetical protein